MKKIIGIDYGIKRVGFAITDLQQIIASPLTTIESSLAMEYIYDITKKEEIESFVIGFPKNHQNNTYTDCTPYMLRFTHHLSEKLNAYPIFLIEEYYTSSIARKSMVSMGLKKKDRQKKSLIDQISAAIILQDFLSLRKNKNPNQFFSKDYPHNKVF